MDNLPESVASLDLDWSEGFPVNTRYGLRTLYMARPTQEFWDVWHTERESLQAEGISCYKDISVHWYVRFWDKEPPPYDPNVLF